MAQVTISEEHYRELIALAQARHVTPDALADELLDTLLTAADQRAFWGEDMDKQIEEALADLESKPHRILTDDEFLADLQAHLKEPPDANA